MSCDDPKCQRCNVPAPPTRFDALSAAYNAQAQKLRAVESELVDARADAFAAKCRVMELETTMREVDEHARAIKGEHTRWLMGSPHVREVMGKIADVSEWIHLAIQRELAKGAAK